nr:hypothetical protein [Haloprofundus halobius]
MVEPTSPLGDDVDEETAPECANCGETILQSSTHRVVAWVEESEVQHRHFCGDDCREAYDVD